MCTTCGCESATSHPHAHSQPGGDLRNAGPRRIALEQNVLARNDAQAADNREWLARRQVVAINLIGAPGAGKTSLIEATAKASPPGRISVVEGDLATEIDAERVRRAGLPAFQVETGTGCHLDASMVRHALEHLDPAPGCLVLIENVGNLVCPALFDLGENERVVVSSVTEGDDKPLKYPHVYRSASLVVLGKIDLLAHVPFDPQAFATNLARVAPRVPLLQASATTGDGVAAWIAWIARSSGNSRGAEGA